MDLLKNLDDMITAEDYLEKKFPEFEDLDNGNIWNNIEKVMVEFAKLHVEAALKQASENIPGFGSSTDIPNWEEVEEEILNSYPLENIK